MGTIVAEQIIETIESEKSVQKLIDYCVLHPDATLKYKASGVILKAHSDALYLLESQIKENSRRVLIHGRCNR